uniref:BTB domain-containing protein n=1 Tax=Amphilophus citrinellus TaxID=61819 RepID=A0A3Q0SRI2_AMPCI
LLLASCWMGPVPSGGPWGSGLSSLCPSSCLSENSGLVSYKLPSHSDRLFTQLQNLFKEELLLDYTFIIEGNSFQAHRLVLAVMSQTPNAFLGSKQVRNTRGSDLQIWRVAPAVSRSDIQDPCPELPRTVKRLRRTLPGLW